jgi:hypothetical protein
MANEAEDINDDINTILTYCSFALGNNTISITEDGFKLLEYILSLTEKDMSRVAKGFAERMVANGMKKFPLVLPGKLLHILLVFLLAWLVHLPLLPAFLHLLSSLLF